MKLFISWSGERSKKVAEMLGKWLKSVIQELDPWVSSGDIQAGARWIPEITDRLAETKFGILCLTKENLNSSWLNFEAGALAKTIDKTYVCPYLIGLEPTDIKMPLGQFQSKRANEEETLNLIQTINFALGEKALSPEILEDAFRTFWPRLDTFLKTLPAGAEERPTRKVEDMVEEILSIVRSIAFMEKRYTERIKPPLGDFIKKLKISDILEQTDKDEVERRIIKGEALLKALAEKKTEIP